MKTEFAVKAMAGLLLIGLLAGCTAADPEAVRQSQLEKHEKRAERIAAQGFAVGEQLDRIDFPRFLDGWGYIDDQAVWLESRPRRYYLVTLKFPCPELAFSQGVRLRSRTTTYLTELDEIVTDSQPVRRCQIDSIYKMTRPKFKKEPKKEPALPREPQPIKSPGSPR